MMIEKKLPESTDAEMVSNKSCIGISNHGSQEGESIETEETLSAQYLL